MRNSIICNFITNEPRQNSHKQIDYLQANLMLTVLMGRMPQNERTELSSAARGVVGEKYKKYMKSFRLFANICKSE